MTNNKPNTNSAKLSAQDVQQIRLLHRHGFNTRSIATAFGVCARSVADIIKARSWWHLPAESVELPLFDPDIALCLRLRSWRGLSDQQRHDIQQYRDAIAAQVEDQAEHEALAAALLSEWMPRRPAGRLKCDVVAAGAEPRG